jgi:hypothetical protein
MPRGSEAQVALSGHTVRSVALVVAARVLLSDPVTAPGC